MATAVKMPQLGMTMTDAKLVRWLKREGEPVSKGEVVAEIETDKLNAEVEANAAGILRRLVAAEGDVVKVTGLMAVIGAADEPEAAIDALVNGGAPAARSQVVAPASAAAGQATRVEAPVETAPAAEGEVRASPIAKRLAADLGVDLTSLAGSGPGGRIVEADVRSAAEAQKAAQVPVSANGYVRASPLAKRLAREHEIDLISVRGTGPDGRVVERDVLGAVKAREAAPATVSVTAGLAAAPAGLTVRETVPMSGIRRVIAERMFASLQQMAQLTLTTEADATALVELRTHLVPAARVYGHRPPSYTDLIVQLAARVLREHPLLNSSLVGAAGGTQEVVCWNEINVGVAVALDRGLVVPVIRDADQKPLQEISREIADMAERARSNRLSPDDMQGGTFTVTNLGLQEIDAFTPVINPPQAAILGVGRIAKKPAVFEDQLAIRHMVTLSLSFDHRLVDGVPAGNYLRDVKRAIEAASFDA